MKKRLEKTDVSHYIEPYSQGHVSYSSNEGSGIGKHLYSEKTSYLESSSAVEVPFSYSYLGTSDPMGRGTSESEVRSHSDYSGSSRIPFSYSNIGSKPEESQFMESVNSSYQSSGYSGDRGSAEHDEAHSVRQKTQSLRAELERKVGSF